VASEGHWASETLVLRGLQLVLVQVLGVLEWSQVVLVEPLLGACLFEEGVAAAPSAICFLFVKVCDAVFLPPHCF